MKQFYIETDQLTVMNKVLRFIYKEDDQNTISFVKVINPDTKEEMTVDEMKKSTAPDALLNMATAYRANYKRVYF